MITRRRNVVTVEPQTEQKPRPNMGCLPTRGVESRMWRGCIGNAAIPPPLGDAARSVHQESCEPDVRRPQSYHHWLIM